MYLQFNYFDSLGSHPRAVLFTAIGTEDFTHTKLQALEYMRYSAHFSLHTLYFMSTLYTVHFTGKPSVSCLGGSPGDCSEALYIH